MKFLIISLAFMISYRAVSQTPDENLKYINWIDSLQMHDALKMDGDTNALRHYFYPNMSFCGGALYGSYYNGKLVAMNSTYGYDSGHTTRSFILRDSTILKVSYTEHFIHDDGKFHLARDNKDTTYTFILSSTPEMSVSVRGKTISKRAVDESLLNQLLECSGMMRRELESEKEEITNTRQLPINPHK